MEAIENINKDIAVLRIKLAELNRGVLSTHAHAHALALRGVARVRLRAGPCFTCRKFEPPKVVAAF